MIAMVDNFPFEEETVNFSPGDTLVIYSDGITEAFDEKDEEFGEAKLEEILRKTVQRPPEEMISSVIEAVTKHAGSMPQTDDITMVILKREE